MDQSLYCADELYNWIKRRGDALHQVIEQKQKELKEYEESLPQGTIRAVYNGRNHMREQYYWREQHDDKCGKYLRKTQKNLKFLKKMIQREYDEKLLKAARAEYRYLQAGKRFLHGDSFRMAYDSIGTLKKKWILPALMSEETYAKTWREKSFEAPRYKDESRLYRTKQGEEVRSKSELFIANALFERNIPYRYECPLKDQNRIWALPDFTILNVHRRKEYYWEHFGMMGDPKYVQKALKKIRTYEKHHMFPGTEMIYTFESSENPIDLENIEEIISQYLTGNFQLG